MKVVEIFTSIDGEGRRAGLPTVFIRLFGCNLHCSYCDTRYACEKDAEYTDMLPGEVVAAVAKTGVKSVTVTGGEPLIHAGIRDLLLSLFEIGCDVNIETNGSVPIGIATSTPGAWVTMDWKSPSSGMHGMNCVDNLDRLRTCDVLKFVVGSKEDLDDMRNVVFGHSFRSRPQIYVSPIFGEIEPKEIVEYILDHGMNNVKVQLQLHKFIWPVEQRGV